MVLARFITTWAMAVALMQAGVMIHDQRYGWGFGLILLGSIALLARDVVVAEEDV